MIIIILVLIPHISGNRFRQGSENYAAPALRSQNTISSDSLASLEKGTILLAGDDNLQVSNSNLSIISLSLNEIKNSSYIKTIRKSTPPIMISSEDPGIEARVWMILAQSGIKQLMIYQEEAESDYLKHEFRPDNSVSKSRNSIDY